MRGVAFASLGQFGITVVAVTIGAKRDNRRHIWELNVTIGIRALSFPYTVRGIEVAFPQP